MSSSHNKSQELSNITSATSKQSTSFNKGQKLLAFFEAQAAQQCYSKEYFNLILIVNLIKNPKNKAFHILHGNYLDYTKIIADTNFQQKLKDGSSLANSFGLMACNKTKYHSDNIKPHQQELAFLTVLCTQLQLTNPDDQKNIDDIIRYCANKNAQTTMPIIPLLKAEKSSNNLGFSIFEPTFRSLFEIAGLLTERPQQPTS